MGSYVTVEQTIEIGKEVVIEGPSPSTHFCVVFEDDGETGYLYALDLSRRDDPILDALHIYDVIAVADKDIPSQVQITWSGDGLKAALLINRYPHAVCDFAAKRSYCRSGFPKGLSRWGNHSRDWDDKAMELFA